MDCVVRYFVVVVCFFSSGSRHTRFWRDWSSDVCSSDLGGGNSGGGSRGGAQLGRELLGELAEHLVGDVGHHAAAELRGRSEERRGGKERRSRWSPYH